MTSESPRRDDRDRAHRARRCRAGCRSSGTVRRCGSVKTMTTIRTAIARPPMRSAGGPRSCRPGARRSSPSRPPERAASQCSFVGHAVDSLLGDGRPSSNRKTGPVDEAPSGDRPGSSSGPGQPPAMLHEVLARLHEVLLRDGLERTACSGRTLPFLRSRRRRARRSRPARATSGRARDLRARLDGVDLSGVTFQPTEKVLPVLPASSMARAAKPPPMSTFSMTWTSLRLPWMNALYAS